MVGEICAFFGGTRLFELFIAHFTFYIVNPMIRYPILFEDLWLIAIDKPAGVLSHPNLKGPSHPCAFEGSYDMEERRFCTLHAPFPFLWLVHRLDRDTSGVLVAAKQTEVARKCRKLFENHEIHKTYLALVRGKPSPRLGKWRDHLKKQTFKGMVRSILLPNRPPNAELQYKILSTFLIPHTSFSAPYSGFLSLLEITPLTGRTHQIRVQAAARNHPIGGDRIYGDFAFNRELRQQVGLQRLFLHAWRLEFHPPITQQPVRLEAPLAEALNRCLNQLRKHEPCTHPK